MSEESMQDIKTKMEDIVYADFTHRCGDEFSRELSHVSVPAMKAIGRVFHSYGLDVFKEEIS